MASGSGRRFISKVQSIIFVCLILFLSTLPIQSDCLEDKSIGKKNVSYSPSGLESSLKKDTSPPPIQNVFTFPSPLPQLTKGSPGGFASGIIDLGGLQVAQVSNLTQVWNTSAGGADNIGITFFEPSSLPNGFFMLGTYAQPNNMPRFGWVLVGKDVIGSSLKSPNDYTLVWSSENNTKIVSLGPGYFFLPNCTDGYVAVGYLVTTNPQKPSLDKMRCVRSDFTNASKTNENIWDVDGVQVFTSMPLEVGAQSPGVPTGSFILQTSSSSWPRPPCLRNQNQNLSSAMPNLTQIHQLMKAYGPTVYFHPNEAFLPSSVEWFLENGALLYTKGNESQPPVLFNSSLAKLLPINLSFSDNHWLGLSGNDTARDCLKRGNLQNASAYVHVKPMFGTTFTDFAVWLFYPFNGPASIKTKLGTFHLDQVGEHVADWEHVTLRISNFNGELKSVFYSQHSGGLWLSPSQLEFQSGTNKPVVYSSKCGHAAFPQQGANLLGDGEVQIRNDCGNGTSVMDTGINFTLLSAQYLGDGVVVEPFWLNYSYLWGPKITYDLGKDLKKLKLGKIIKLPNEVMGECGPIGPKWKESWIGDEQTWP
ncbi:hypothetical protein DM860_004414 [Cuscuta australis]|uniref:Peptidase A1 domain-containing protein n=1 Tax=Cuscuta australis TaxID=267555 RepID=A0A328EBI4_9ASTE|nr:hypothetical protein DM860_004414 [Cuscuta australis]